MKGTKTKEFKDYISKYKYNDIITLECPQCLNEFNREKRHITSSIFNSSKTANNIYCSKECADEAHRNKIECECKQCLKGVLRTPSQIKKTKNVFCSRSCAAVFNNNIIHKIVNKNIFKCKNCNKDFKRKDKEQLYCSRKCVFEYQKAESIENPKSIGSIKKRIIRDRGYNCEKCGISEWMKEAISLELDHIDGNSLNDTFDNLKLLCPNCHSQTPTYRAKNKGNGRRWRKKP